MEFNGKTVSCFATFVSNPAADAEGIEAALDEIIAIQNSLIGGGSV